MLRQRRWAVVLLHAASIGSSFTYHGPSCIHRERLQVIEESSCSGDEEDIPILLETDQVLVVNKPPGVSHHDDSDELGIVNRLRATSSSTTPRIYGVHRLDRVTSGILVLAKSSAVAGSMQRMFRDGKVIKYYVGLSSKKPKKKQGLVEGGMVRGRRSSWYLTRSTTSEHKKSDITAPYAKTRFYTAGLGHLEGGGSEARTLVLFRPYTGKTHQLRVSSKSVGLPLLGDPIYGSSNAESVAATRTFLHAYALHIPAADDAGHEAITVVCEPTFYDAWGDTNQAHQVFSQSLEGLFRKHCEFEPFLSTTVVPSSFDDAE